MSLSARVKLGAVAASGVSVQTPHIGVPPATAHWTTSATRFPMYGNVQVGDCTAATIGHMIEVWCAANGSAYLPSLKDVLHIYNSTPDTGGGGRNMEDVLNYVKINGISSDRGLHKLYWKKIDAGNRTALKCAIYFLGGGCSISLGLPTSSTTQRVWRKTATNDALASYGWHQVQLIGYNSVGPIACTWDKLIPMTWGFYDEYVGDAYAVLGWDWISPTTTEPGQFPKSPLGHTWKQLATAFRIGG